MTIPGEIFRALHQQHGTFVIPNPWDIGSARILAGLGFKALTQAAYGALITAAHQIAENGRFQFGDIAIGYASVYGKYRSDAGDRS